MVRKIRNTLWLLFFLAASFLGAWIVADNNHLVDFNLFGFSIQQEALGLLVLVSFAAGLCLGLFGNVLFTSWLIIRLNRLQKRLNRQEVKSTAPGKLV